MRKEYRNYCDMEVALSCENCLDTSGGERKKVGDIIAVRHPIGMIGLKEAEIYLWLTLTGLEMLEYNAFRDPVEDDPIIYDKRRYCIPFHRIEQLYPSFDANRAYDKNDVYQPFFVLDKDNYKFLSTSVIFEVSGLVFDKVTGKYL